MALLNSVPISANPVGRAHFTCIQFVSELYLTADVGLDSEVSAQSSSEQGTQSDTLNQQQQSSAQQQQSVPHAAAITEQKSFQVIPCTENDVLCQADPNLDL